MQNDVVMEISLKDIFMAIKRSLAGIAIFTECVLIIVSLYTYFLVDDQFTSSVVFTVVTKNEESAQISQSDLSANLQLVNDYKNIVDSRTVKDAVMKNLGLSSLSGYKISVDAKSSSRCISITVTGPSAYMTANVANNLYLEFREQVFRLLKVDNVAVVDSAVVAKRPSAPAREKTILIGTLAGIVAAIAFVVVRDMLDTTIKTADDVEKQLGLPLLAQIPKVEGEDSKKHSSHSKRSANK